MSEGGWVGLSGFSLISGKIAVRGGVSSFGLVGWLVAELDRQRCSWAEAHRDTLGCCHLMSMGNVGGRPSSVTPPPPGIWVGEPKSQGGQSPPPPRYH